MNTPDPYTAFVAQLAAHLLATVPGVRAVSEVLGLLHLTTDDEARVRINPRNAYRAVQTGEPLDLVLTRQAEVIAASLTSTSREPEAWADVAPRVVTRLETATLARQESRIARPWAVTPVLWEIAVVDAPTHMRGVTADDAEAWAQQSEALLAHGLTTLRRIAQAGPRPRQVNGAIWLLASSDGYAASRLLLPDWLLAHLPARRATRGWLCVAPARDALAFTPLRGEEAEDFDQVARFAAAVRELGRMSHPFPFAPLILDRDGLLRPLAGETARVA